MAIPRRAGLGTYLPAASRPHPQASQCAKTTLLLRNGLSLLMATSRHSVAQNRLLLYPQQRTFGLGQIETPACRCRDGLTDAVQIALGGVPCRPARTRDGGSGLATRIEPDWPAGDQVGAVAPRSVTGRGRSPARTRPRPAAGRFSPPTPRCRATDGLSSWAWRWSCGLRLRSGEEPFRHRDEGQEVVA